MTLLLSLGLLLWSLVPVLKVPKLKKKQIASNKLLFLHWPTLCGPFQKKYRDFRLQGVLDSTLNSKMYETVKNRLMLEEATASVRDGGMQGISMKDSDEEDN